MRTADGYIVNKCLNGDPAAFGLLVDKYKEGVYALAYSKLRNFHDAEDLTQEVFIKAYKRLRSLRRWDNFHAWIYAITSNLCKDWIRARSRRPDREFIQDQDPKVLGCPSIDPDDENPVVDLVHEALDSLPEIYRQVLTLHYLGGMNSREIAEFLGTSPTAIWQRLSRARAQLKEEILARIGATFDERRLKVGFTFRIVEAVKRMKIQPMPRATGLPWGMSLAAGIIIALMTLSPHLSLLNSTSFPMGSPLPAEAKVLKTGEIPVDILEVSQMPVLASKQSDRADMPAARAALSTSPEAAEDAKEAADHPAEEPGYYMIGAYAETPEQVEFARGFFRHEDSDSGLISDGYGTVGVYTTGRGPEPTGMYMAHRCVNSPGIHLRLPAPVGTEWAEESTEKWKSKANTVVESNTELVAVPAGTFWNCLKLKTVISGSEGTRNERDFLDGTRYMWFAPGVGLVKLEYHHNDDTTTNVELISYSVSEKDRQYFPLDLGNRWTYEWTNGYRDHKVRETWAVISTSRNTFEVCWYLFSYGRDPEEEEIREGWNLREEVKRRCNLSDEELDAAAQPLLDWRFAEWKDGRLEGFDVEALHELRNSHGRDEKGDRFR